MKKKIITIIFLSCLEIIVFVLLEEYLFSTFFPPSIIRMLDTAISLQIAFIEFIIFALLLNTFLMTYRGVNPIWAIGAATLLYSLTWVSDLFNSPTVTLKLVVSACVGFLSYYFFSRLLKTITKKFI